MNKTKIEWTDYTWNPVTGCWGPGGTAEEPNRCPYCYAVGIQKRFGHVGLGDPFMPIFYSERLDEPTKIKKPSKVFVCSMADLFGDWVPDEWIHQIIYIAENCPQHIFQFLTKNPKRLSRFPWPENCWLGTTVTDQYDADERLPWLCQTNAEIRFVSHEPLLGKINHLGMIPYFYDDFPGCINPLTGEWWPAVGNAEEEYRNRVQMERIDWAIIGAMTGPKAVKPEPQWVSRLIHQYQAAGVAVFCKDNLNLANKTIREWPK